MRTIDADALIESIKRQCNFCRLTADDELIQQFIDVLEKGFIEEVDNAPTIEPKQGEWIDMGDFEQCSVCKGTHLKEFQSYYGKTTWIKTPYCPKCGAKMKGADDETAND